MGCECTCCETSCSSEWSIDGLGCVDSGISVLAPSLLAGVSDNSCVSVFREEKRSLQGIPVCFSERKGHL